MRIFTFILLFISFSGAAQNLLLNGGFEEENICSEYKVNCAPEAWMYTQPSFIYYFTNERAVQGGKHYVAIIGGHTNKPYYRTFIRSRLLCRLHKGHTYRLEFSVRSVHPVLDSIGIYFTDYDFLYEKKLYKDIRPSLFLADAVQKPQKNDTGWQKVVLDYTATGNEAYITLGNFRKTDIRGPTGIDKENNFFILFDDISMVPLHKNEVLCRDWKKNREEIYSQDERHEYQLANVKRYRNNTPSFKPYNAGIILKVDTFIVPDILFPTGSFTINRNTQLLLDSFAHRLINMKLDSIVVNGHTDIRGTDEANLQLSWRRASTVGSYLEKKLSFKTVSRGLGSGYPIATNRTTEGRQRNRRVEILIYKQE